MSYGIAYSIQECQIICNRICFVVFQAGVGIGDKRSRSRSSSVFYTYLDLPENVYEEIDIRGNNDANAIDKRPVQGLRTLWAETDEVIARGILGKTL